MNDYSPFDTTQTEYIRACQHNWFNVAEGGKRGGKNVINVLAFCIALEDHPDKLHLIAGVSIANAKINVLDCDGFGVTNYFNGRCKEGKYKNRDCLYIDTVNGKKVILVAGGAKEGDEKYIKGNTYGMAYITEANECCLTFIKEVFDRTISSNDRKIFHDLNPKSPKHKYYTEVLDTHSKKQKGNSSYGYNWKHFNIFNNLSISNDKLEQVLSTYDKSSLYYKREILGLRKQAEGMCFSDFLKVMHKLKWKGDLPKGYTIVGIDYGGNKSAHAFVAVRIAFDHSKVIILSSRKLQTKVTSQELEDAQFSFIKMIMEKYKCTINDVYPDNAESVHVNSIDERCSKEGLGNVVRGCKKIRINDRIGLVNKLATNDMLYYVEEECETIISALENAAWDEKKFDDERLDNGSSDIDSCDAFEYTIERDLTRFITYMNLKEKK